MARNVLVTGAARGIGRAIALRLARDGLNVAVNDIKENFAQLNDVQKTIEKIGRKSIAISGDVSNDKDVETMVKNTANELGSLDVRGIFFF
jgi:meso-butanediol dehydrogenase/(S,S)-butanediol dehydrogenase/diacetyl reductase